MIHLTPIDIGRLKKISYDVDTVESLKKLFLSSFLKPKSTDVQILASSRIAIDLLDRAFKDLEVLRGREDIKSNNENPAL